MDINLRRTVEVVADLHDLTRSTRLNVLYYGPRAATYSNWNTRLQLVASILSLSSVGTLLGAVPHGQVVALFTGVAAAISAALPSLLAYTDKIKTFEGLHSSYCELFHLTKRLVIEIRRIGTVTDEQVGQARLLHEMYLRLGSRDEPDPNKKLCQIAEFRVRDEFPAESLWYPQANGDREEATTIASTTTETR